MDIDYPCAYQRSLLHLLCAIFRNLDRPAPLQHLRCCRVWQYSFLQFHGVHSLTAHYLLEEASKYRIFQSFGHAFHIRFDRADHHHLP